MPGSGPSPGSAGRASSGVLCRRIEGIIPAMDRRSAFGEAFLEKLGTSPSENVPLSAMSSFGIGGPADLFFEARTEAELEAAVSLAVAEHFPFYVIGGGNNLLFDDAGYRGIIIRNRLEGLARKEDRMSVLSGTGSPASCARPSRRHSAASSSWPGSRGRSGGPSTGTPGPTDGASETSSKRRPSSGLAESGRPFPGKSWASATGIRLLKKTGGIVLSATILCSPGDSQESEEQIRDILEKRWTKHPPHGHGLRRELLQEFLFRDRGADRRRAAPRAGRGPGTHGRRRGRLRQPLQLHHQQGERQVERRPCPGRSSSRKRSTKLSASVSRRRSSPSEQTLQCSDASGRKAALCGQAEDLSPQDHDKPLSRPDRPAGLRDASGPWRYPPGGRGRSGPFPAQGFLRSVKFLAGAEGASWRRRPLRSPPFARPRRPSTPARRGRSKRACRRRGRGACPSSDRSRTWPRSARTISAAAVDRRRVAFDPPGDALEDRSRRVLPRKGLDGVEGGDVRRRAGREARGSRAGRSPLVWKTERPAHAPPDRARPAATRPTASSGTAMMIGPLAPAAAAERGRSPALTDDAPGLAGRPGVPVDDGFDVPAPAGQRRPKRCAQPARADDRERFFMAWT